jgi:ADP-ribose pyrophosphatase
VAVIAHHSQNMKWTATARRLLHQGLLRVEEHDIVTHDGRAFTMPVFHGPPGAVVVPVDVEGRIHFVRQHRYALNEWTIEMPAGKVDPGETAEQAARRELHEETCLLADNLIDLGTYGSSVNVSPVTTTIFLALDCTADGSARDDEDCRPLPLLVDDPHRLVQERSLPTCSATALLLAWPHIMRHRQTRAARRARS